MSYSNDHDRFVAKNRSLAAAEEMNSRDKTMEKKGLSYQQQKESSCFNCKMKRDCSQFKSRSTGRGSGAVSFGGEQNFICDRYTPADNGNKGISQKKIKSLLKNAKRGL